MTSIQKQTGEDNAIHDVDDWTQAPDGSWTRPTEGNERFFSIALGDYPGPKFPLKSTIFLQLDKAINTGDLQRRVRTAWSQAYAIHPILAVRINADATFSFREPESKTQVDHWVDQTFSTLVLPGEASDKGASDLKSFKEAVIRANDANSDDALPGPDGDLASAQLILAPSSVDEQSLIAISVRIAHAIADGGTTAILASEMRRLLSAPDEALKNADWSSAAFRLQRRKRLPSRPTTILGKPPARGSKEFSERSAAFHRSQLQRKFEAGEPIAPQTFRNQQVVGRFDKETSAKIRDFTRSNQITVSTLFQAVVILCLSLYRDAKQPQEEKPTDFDYIYHFMTPVDYRAVLPNKKQTGITLGFCTMELPLGKAFQEIGDRRDQETGQVNDESLFRRVALMLAKAVEQDYQRARPHQGRIEAGQWVDSDVDVLFEGMMQSKTIDLSKAVGFFFSDSVVDQRYLDVDVAVSEDGIASRMVDYDFSMNQGLGFTPPTFRSWSFDGCINLISSSTPVFHHSADQQKIVNIIITIIETLVSDV